MITSLVLTSLLMYSGVNAYQGIDMSDEDFNQFVDTHYDMFDTVQTFISDNRHQFETGVIGSLAVAALKPALNSAHPITNLIMIGGSTELAKNLYKNAVSGKVAKQDEVDELRQQLAVAVNKLNEIEASLRLAKNSNSQYVSAGDFTSGYAHNPSEGSHDERSSVYTTGGRTYTSDSREAGPHRSEYRTYRERGDVKDVVDRIYPRDNYVEK